jgi:hypothetical protein
MSLCYTIASYTVASHRLAQYFGIGITEIDDSAKGTKQ